MLSKKECQLAHRKWQSSKRNVNEILRLFPSNFIFTISQEDVKWIIKENQNSCFQAYLGVHEDRAIMIFLPLNSKGGIKNNLDEYPISILQALRSEIKFVEKEVYTQTKTAILSKDLKVVSRVVEETKPLFQHQIECQDSILMEIEDWRNEATDWFIKQINETEGESIFNMFNIPIEDLSDGCDDIIGLFAFKYSKIYGEVLPTIIFVHNESSMLENTILHSIQTNLYNWSQPCPPFCRPKGGKTLLED